MPGEDYDIQSHVSTRKVLHSRSRVIRLRHIDLRPFVTLQWRRQRSSLRLFNFHPHFQLLRLLLYCIVHFIFLLSSSHINSRLISNWTRIATEWTKLAWAEKLMWFHATLCSRLSNGEFANFNSEHTYINLHLISVDIP